MSLPTIYGIKTCATCRKLLQQLTAAGTVHQFVDVRANPVDPVTLQTWADQLGWDKLVNRSSTTWRELPEALKPAKTSADWLKLLEQFPTLLKRPLVQVEDRVSIGMPTV